LGQVFLNLLVNAAQAIAEGRPESNEVRLVSRVEGTCAVVEVQDTGCGIDADVRARLFEPFFTTKPKGVGTGLGLSICKGIVESHGGRLSVESQPGEGTTFRVELPLAAAEMANGVVGEGAKPEKPNVLVVDDDAPALRAVANILKERFNVVTASDAAQARVVSAGMKLSLVLTDYVMPEESGLELIRSLRAVAESAPAALLTSMAETPDMRRAVQSGEILAVVSKALPVGELLEMATRLALETPKAGFQSEAA
jgi:CheY-like chemotaxis protein